MKGLCFGMRHRRSKNPLLRLFAGICLFFVRKRTDLMEKRAQKADENKDSLCPAPDAKEMLKLAIQRKNEK